MNKKLLIAIIAIIAALCGAFGFSACGGDTGDETPDNPSGDNTNPSTHTTHTYDKKVAEQEYLKTPADCTHKAVYFYSCECGGKGTETFEYGETVNHNFNKEVVTEEYLVREATCTQKAVYFYSCECGEKGEYIFEYGEANGHSFTDQVAWQYLKSEADCTHKAVYFKSCSVCNAYGTETFEYGEANGHMFIDRVAEQYLKSEANCIHKAIYYRSCFVCGANGTDTFEHGIYFGEHVFESGKCTKCGDLYPTEGISYILEDWYYSCNIGTATDSDIVIARIYNGLPVTEIMAYGFQNCNFITSVNIPEGVTGIYYHAFDGCRNLNSVKIPESVFYIGFEAFANCPNLIKTENGVQYVDKWAVGCDTSLQSLVFRNDTKGIADNSFCRSNIENISIPDSVKYIGNNVFCGCDNLKIITIGSGVTKIGSAFNDFSSLTSITVDEDNEVYSSRNGILYNKDKTVILRVPHNISENFFVPDGVTKIEGHAFSNCHNLTNLIISDSVTIISVQAFMGCGSLKNVTIPAALISINNLAFQGCINLESISVDENNTVYSSLDGILYNKDKTEIIKVPQTITSFIIPIDVITIGNYAFLGCIKLESITFNGKITQWNEIEKESYWDLDTGNYIIHCTDGDIAKSGS